MHFSMLNVIVFICFVCATKDLYWLCPSMVRVTFLYDAAIRCRLACRLQGLCPLTPLMHAERSLTTQNCRPNPVGAAFPGPVKPTWSGVCLQSPAEKTGVFQIGSVTVGPKTIHCF